MLRQRCNLMMTLAGLMLALASCTGHYRIDGVVETLGYEGRELSLIEFLPYRTTKYDSCVVNHGRFQMTGKADTTRLVFLCKDNRPIIPIYIEKGNAKVSLLPTEMTVSGTRQNDLFYSFLKKKIAYDNLYEDLSQRRFSMSRQGLDSRRMEIIQDSLRIVVDECEDMICSFMADNYDEPAAVGVFMMLSAGPTNEVSSLVRRILDAAPDEFMRQSYVNGYISRTGYARNE
ncbi:MAG: DUF4369 domain-containing protein [Bacteroidaceae bacterium]|nr:DUF4369 domain-containing protein [Bacteroidaceae bacterium]